jgi:hypothetical protein
MHVVHGGLSAPSKCVSTLPRKDRCTPRSAGSRHARLRASRPLLERANARSASSTTGAPRPFLGKADALRDLGQACSDERRCALTHPRKGQCTRTMADSSPRRWCAPRPLRGRADARQRGRPSDPGRGPVRLDPSSEGPMHQNRAPPPEPEDRSATRPFLGRANAHRGSEALLPDVPFDPSAEGPMHAKPLLRLHLERVQFVLEVLDPLPDRLPLLATED